ncbi:uncharacterized protein [Montipora foliosa]
MMCCPGLKHLNLSGCRNITDAAFALPTSVKSSLNTCNAADSFSSRIHLSQPGCSLTSVDISGCGSISTVAVKYLVALCGPDLKSVNLACTGVDSIALLYLAGINTEHIERLMCNTDCVSVSLLELSEDVNHHFHHHKSLQCCTIQKAVHTDQVAVEEGILAAETTENVHDSVNLKMPQRMSLPDSGISVTPQSCFSPSSLINQVLPADLCNYDKKDTNSVEVSMLKSSLAVASKSQAGDVCNCIELSDDESSDDSFKTASDEMELSILCEKETNLQFAGQNTCNLRNEKTLSPEVQEKCSDGDHDRGRQIINDEGKSEIFGMSEICASVGATLLSCSQAKVTDFSVLGNDDHTCRKANTADFMGGATSNFEECLDEQSQLEVTYEDQINVKDDTSGCKASTELTGMLQDDGTMYQKGVKDEKLSCLPSCRGEVNCNDFKQMQVYKPQITALDITSILNQSKPLGMACLKVFARTCKCLKNFSVSGNELDDEVLIYVLKNEPELECLSLVDCENLSNLSLSTIPVHCPKLTSFDLKGVCYVTDYGVIPLTTNSNLKSLHLAEAAVTDSTLETVAKGCGGKLKELDVSWCEDLTDHGMSMMANSCSSLQYLSLRQCAASHLTLSALAQNCHLISSLDIAGVNSLTDEGLGNLARNMPHLRDIDASWNSSLSDNGIFTLLESCVELNRAVLCGLKGITSQPFLAIIGDLGRWCLLEELWRLNRRSQSGADPKGKVTLKTCDPETAKSIGNQMPWRSMSYAPSLRQILVEYSDKVNDDHLAAVVAVCRGTLFVKDYYGQSVKPKWIFR